MPLVTGQSTFTFTQSSCCTYLDTTCRTMNRTMRGPTATRNQGKTPAITPTQKNTRMTFWMNISAWKGKRTSTGKDGRKKRKILSTETWNNLYTPIQSGCASSHCASSALMQLWPNYHLCYTTTSPWNSGLPLHKLLRVHVQFVGTKAHFLLYKWIDKLEVSTAF